MFKIFNKSKNNAALVWVTTDACTAGMRTGILVEDSLTRSLLVPVWIHDAFINQYILTLGNVKSTSSLWSPADSSHNQNLKLSISALRSHWVQYHFFWVVYADLNDVGSSTKSTTTGFEHRGSSLWVSLVQLTSWSMTQNMVTQSRGPQYGP